MNRQRILRQALIARQDEVLGYQINIDNYRLAIDRIDSIYGSDLNMLAFRAELCKRLAVEAAQQNRAILIRDVIKEQVGPPPIAAVIPCWIRDYFRVFFWKREYSNQQPAIR